MASSPARQTSKWVQKLLPACDGDLSHAKRQLIWLKEKVIFDLRGESTSKIDPLSHKEQIQLDKYIDERVSQHKPLQYILGKAIICLLFKIRQYNKV